MAFELDRRQLRRRFLEKLATASLLLVLAIAFTWAWLDDAWVFGHTGDARPAAADSPDEHTILQVILGIAVALWILYLAMLAYLLRPYLRKRRLLSHGIPEVLGSARVETSVYSLAGPAITIWRLCAGQFDASLPGWREYCSDWQKGSPPKLDANTPLPPLLRDPANPSRHWLPVATWAAERDAAP